MLSVEQEMSTARREEGGGEPGCHELGCQARNEGGIESQGAMVTGSR